MKLMKKTLIITIFTIFFFILISNVSATEVNITNGTPEGIKNTITGGYDTIYLQPGIYSGENNTNITISNDVTIIGNGNSADIIIDSNNNSRSFIINSNVNVKLINITFINGYISNGDGGTILVNGNLELINCSFLDNNAIRIDSNTGRGGAIAISRNGSINISNCDFKNNGAERGAAIFADCTNNVNIISSNFTNNNASRHAGAIYFNRAGMLVTIANSLFNKNNASAQGGAVYINKDVIVNMTNTNFTNNAASEAGAIFINEGTLNSSNSSFINNKANDAGAIYINHNGIAYMDKNLFNLNNASSNGSAVFVNYDGSLFVNSSTFTNNYANIGGAIYNIGNSTIQYSILYHNSDSQNNTLVNELDGKFNGDNNWWGTNNITGMYTGFLVNNHYIMNLTINNISKYGDDLVISYSLLNNETKDSNNSDLLPLFSGYLDYNNERFTISDGRESQNFETTANEINNTLKTYYSDDFVIGMSFNLSKLDTSLKIETIPNTVGEKTTIIGTLIDEKGNPLSGVKINFYANGKYIGYGITNDEGIATLTYTFNKAGKYSIRAEYLGNEYYSDTEGNTEINIKENSQPNPNENNNNNNNKKTRKNLVSNAAMKETGTPLIALILVLLSNLAIIFFRKN